jgi:hypothetical protein
MAPYINRTSGPPYNSGPLGVESRSTSAASLLLVGKIAKKGTVFFGTFVIGDIKINKQNFMSMPPFNLQTPYPSSTKAKKKVFLYACLRYQL